MNYAILVVDFNVFNMKTVLTKLTTVYTTLKQTVGLTLIWLVGLNRKKLELACFFSMSNWVNRTQIHGHVPVHSFFVMQKSGMIHLLC
jgi:hypothetical protein